MLSKSTASLRATATMARFLPRLPPQAASLRQEAQRRVGTKATQDVLRRLHQQTAQVAVARLGNPALRVAVARLLLTGSEAEIGARLAVGFHRFRIAQRQYIAGRHDRTYPGGGTQKSDLRIFFSQALNLLVHRSQGPVPLRNLFQ